jgi:hypothetical protein
VLVAILLLIIATLLIGYRFFTSALLDQLYKVTTEKVNETLASVITDEFREKTRNDAIDNVLKVNPTMTREHLLENHGAMIDHKIDLALEAATDKFRTGAFLKVSLEPPTEQSPPNPSER